MKKKPKLRNEALIFVNGPYQLMVGLACLQKHQKSINTIHVISYDMSWQADLSKITQDFTNILGLNFIKLPFEFKKSDISNFKTHKIRTLINHILFYIYSKVYAKSYIFVPKIVGSPERAIILASLDTKINIYDDGFGNYIDPGVRQRKLDLWLFDYIKKISSRREVKIEICPRKPELITYSKFQSVPVSGFDYSEELLSIIQSLSDHYNDLIVSNLTAKTFGKRNIIIILPRLSLSVEKQLGKDIKQLIEAVSKLSPNTFFLLKPHPRDITLNFQFINQYLCDCQNWELLPKSIWSLPAEIVLYSLKPEITVSGCSTVGINADLFVFTKTMVFEFLSFNLPYYNDSAKMVMKKAGNYFGETVEEAIFEVSNYLRLK